MNQNLYENDLGAINEAMPDILGNLLNRLVLSDTEAFENKEWRLHMTQMDIKTKSELVKDYTAGEGSGETERFCRKREAADKESGTEKE